MPAQKGDEFSGQQFQEDEVNFAGRSVDSRCKEWGIAVTNMDRHELLKLLEPHGQSHLVDWFHELSVDQQSRLAHQVRQLDFTLIARLIALRDQKNSAAGERRAARAEAPQELVRLADSNNAAAREAGERLLADGKVAAILVAGGQGSRLGFEAPKGIFPIGPVSQRSLFQMHCEQLLARSRRAGRTIPYLIMTSDATHEATVDFFRTHDYFGLPASSVHFFQQASLPAIDAGSNRILLADKHELTLSPDGHGGILRALKQSGLLDEMKSEGIEHFFYHQVDNPTAILCDPVFLGLHAQRRSDMSTKVVAKVDPHERMGVIVTLDGQTQIIEYSDLSRDEAERVDAAGQPIFWAGNTAIHALRREFLDELTSGDAGLPFHIAHKPVACLNTDGLVINADPKCPNAHKFEQFIFDALPQAQVALVVEADRQREFNPVKNATGADSPVTSRAALNRIAREWITAAGGHVDPGINLEISPLFALDAEELATRISAGTRYQQPTVLGPR